MARVYATPDQLAAYTGQPAPADAARLLSRASRFLDERVLKACLYATDDDGMPTAPELRDAFREAVCIQVGWWDEVGDSTGAAGAGWGSVTLGPVTLGRSVTDVSPDASPARMLAPEAWDLLRTLPPDVIRWEVIW
ncbi:hypothetical protein [Streptomyces similanensis]|uniref:Uncharacterized protein n=1 Tax=Streptomyces similanensis TaxID=1274988 RepID=A0ABP9KGM2_9ACTN